MNIKQVIAETADKNWRPNPVSEAVDPFSHAVASYDGGEEAASAYNQATGNNITPIHDDSFYGRHGDHHVYVGYGSREGDFSKIHVNGKALEIPALSDDAERDMSEHEDFRLASDEVSHHLHGKTELSSEEKQAAHNVFNGGLRGMYS